MASLIFSPLRFTCTSSNFRFPFSGPRIRVCISPSRRVWTRSSKSMSKSAGQESLPSQDQDGVKTENSDVLVQYVVLRRDLIDTWPLGSVVTQGCHASVCAIWSHKDDPHTVDYCSAQNIDSMHKSRVSLLWTVGWPCEITSSTPPSQSDESCTESKTTHTERDMAFTGKEMR
ncbi:hypothetical protein I3843_07G207700 [Carya illinoinensis]|nr:hypothetical protein I3843_07G207700 [Carya illinoinensis]